VNNISLFWSDEDDCFIAKISETPISVFGDTEDEALASLAYANYLLFQVAEEEREKQSSCADHLAVVADALAEEIKAIDALDNEREYRVYDAWKCYIHCKNEYDEMFKWISRVNRCVKSYSTESELALAMEELVAEPQIKKWLMQPYERDSIRAGDR